MDEMTAIVPVNGRDVRIGEDGKRRRGEEGGPMLRRQYKRMLSHPRPQCFDDIDIEVRLCALVWVYQDPKKGHKVID